MFIMVWPHEKNAKTKIPRRTLQLKFKGERPIGQPSIRRFSKVLEDFQK
jgi:hypothetical protein